VPLKLHTDPGSAVLAGLVAMFALMLMCTFWIWTGWVDGAGAAAMTAVFCCLFAALDNPVPAILNFGGSIIASIPVAGVVLFGILPHIETFEMLCLVLLPICLVAGVFMMHPRYGLFSTALMVGFGSGIAIRKPIPPISPISSTPMSGRWWPWPCRRGDGHLPHGQRGNGDPPSGEAPACDLAKLAGARTPPDPTRTLVHATDQLALITQRLSTDSEPRSRGWARCAWRSISPPSSNCGWGRRVRSTSRWPACCAPRGAFRHQPARRAPPPELLGQIDKALRPDGLIPSPETAGELIGTGALPQP
jgi:hypothetical protein